MKARYEMNKQEKIAFMKELSKRISQKIGHKNPAMDGEFGAKIDAAIELMSDNTSLTHIIAKIIDEVLYGE